MNKSQKQAFSQWKTTVTYDTCTCLKFLWHKCLTHVVWNESLGIRAPFCQSDATLASTIYAERIQSTKYFLLLFLLQMCNNAMDSKLCTWTHEMSHQIKLCQDLKSTHSRPQNSSNCTELQPIRKVTGQRSHTEFCYSKQWNLMYFPCPEPSSIEFLQNRLMIIAAETRKEKAGEGRKECKRWKLSQYSICNLSHYHTIRLGRECTANLQFK